MIYEWRADPSEDTREQRHRRVLGGDGAAHVREQTRERGEPEVSRLTGHVRTCVVVAAVVVVMVAMLRRRQLLLLWSVMIITTLLLLLLLLSSPVSSTRLEPCATWTSFGTCAPSLSRSSSGWRACRSASEWTDQTYIMNGAARLFEHERAVGHDPRSRALIARRGDVRGERGEHVELRGRAVMTISRSLDYT